MWSNIFFKWCGAILQQRFGRFFIKKPIFGTRKMENDFFVQRKWKLPFEKLFAIARCTLVHSMISFEQAIPWMWPYHWSFAWNPWIFIHDSSFLRTLFLNICRIPSLLFFLETRSHIMTQSEGFQFFWISCARFKMRSKRRAWPFVARGWILQNFWSFSD